VLDVGAGAGAASLALVPLPARVVAVDESPAMLDTFRREADRVGVLHREVLGRWPDVAQETPTADVVVCHHVLYNVSDVVPFVRALADHARRRVVVELTARHPQVALNDLWRHFHAISRPSGPSAADAVAVLREAGILAHVEGFDRPPRPAGKRTDLVAFVRRRLCLGAERDAELDALLRTRSPFSGGPAVTLWWDTTVAR
jgi:SAM-dependent methyltransferase